MNKLGLNTLRISSGFIISGSGNTYADLPAQTESNSNQGQLWFVESGSGGFWSAVGVYKYPVGLYTPNESDVWQLVPFNVKVAEDASTLINITNWTEFFAYSFDINNGDVLIYNGVEYYNITGNYNSAAPSVDNVNWRPKVLGLILSSSQVLSNGNTNVIITQSGIVCSLNSSPVVNNEVKITNDSDGTVIIDGNSNIVYDTDSVNLYSGESLLLVFLNNKWNVV